MGDNKNPCHGFLVIKFNFGTDGIQTVFHLRFVLVESANKYIFEAKQDV